MAEKTHEVYLLGGDQGHAVLCLGGLPSIHNWVIDSTIFRNQRKNNPRYNVTTAQAACIPHSKEKTSKWHDHFLQITSLWVVIWKRNLLSLVPKGKAGTSGGWSQTDTWVDLLIIRSVKKWSEQLLKNSAIFGLRDVQRETGQQHIRKVARKFYIYGSRLSPPWLAIHQKMVLFGNHHVPTSHRLPAPMTTTCPIVVNTCESVCLTPERLSFMQKHLCLNHTC